MPISKKPIEKGTKSPPKILLMPFDISAEEALKAVKDHLGIGKKVKKEEEN